MQHPWGNLETPFLQLTAKVLLALPMASPLSHTYTLEGPELSATPKPYEPVGPQKEPPGSGKEERLRNPEHYTVPTAPGRTQES